MIKSFKYLKCLKYKKANIKYFSQINENDVNKNLLINDNKIINENSIDNEILNQTPENINYLKYLNPYEIYLTVDNYIREFIFFLSETQNLGIGLGIMLSSLTFKICLSPLIFQIKDITKKFQDKKEDFEILSKNLTEAYMRQEKEKAEELKIQLNEFKKKNGLKKINKIIVFQLFSLSVWFFSLKYLVTNKELFPYIINQNFLWLDNIYTTDQYFILPIIISLINFFNIKINFYNQKQNLLDENILKLLKFLPFVSSIFLSFLPSGLLLHFSILSSVQLYINLASNKKNLFEKKRDIN